MPSGYLAVTGQTIEASQHNPPLEDLAAAMTRRYMRDGRAPMLGNIPMNGYRATGAGDGVDAQDYVTLAQVQALIAAVASVPTGLIVPYTGNTVPAGWVAANGQELSRTTYAALWAHAQASGNLAASQGAKTHGQFGPGNGSTTFTVPNLYADNGYFIRPLATGRTIGSVQADELASHSHGATFSGNPVPAHNHNATYASAGAGGSYTDALNRARTGDGAYGFGSGETVGLQSSGGHTPSGSVSVTATGGTETRPRNIAYPVIIKA